ncbi:MAG: EamA family transporter [Lysobacter sp.]|nr:MAG: EamA family transporter [Lysobacter sp.]
MPRLRDQVFGFALLMAFDTFAQVSFKFAGMHAFPPELSVRWLLRLLAQPWLYGAVLGYVGTFFIWISLLKRTAVGPAVAASHMEVVSVMLVSSFLFGERIGPGQASGAVLIVAGIVCLAIGERDAAARQARDIGQEICP